jgi:hypothetical protein
VIAITVGDGRLVCTLMSIHLPRHRAARHGGAAGTFSDAAR